MLLSLTLAADALLRDAPVGGEVVQRVAQTQMPFGLIPSPLLIGLGLFVLSAIIVVGLELRAEHARGKRYSAARF